MKTNKDTHNMYFVFVFFLFSLVILVACSAQTISITPTPLPTNTQVPPTAIPPTPTTIPRPPLSADEVKTLAAAFDKISNAHIDAWNKHDINLLRQLYTDDIVLYYEGNTPNNNGIDSVVANDVGALSENPQLAGRLDDTYIGRAQGFGIFENWNVEGFNEQNPAIKYNWFTLQDGKMSEWWQFRDAVYYGKQGLTFDFTPLKYYETAWSSGDAEKVASLYNPQVVRQDTLFGENQQGSTAVKEFATNFFAWYPGVRLELLKSFELFLSDPVMEGGVYAIHVSDKAGKPCDVRAIILLEVPQDKITKEWVFYNADSLIACGWAQ
jgi:ketosteroid isomerase-like protein